MKYLFTGIRVIMAMIVLLSPGFRVSAQTNDTKTITVLKQRAVPAGGEFRVTAETALRFIGDMNAHTHTYFEPSQNIESHYAVKQDPYWCGFYIPLSHVDMSGTTGLSFMVRAAADGANPRAFKIEIQDGTNTFEWYVFDVTLWSEPVTVSFAAIQGLNPAAITQINVIYEQNTIVNQNGSQQGTVIFDQFRIVS